jgi:hypothetical protein
MGHSGFLRLQHDIGRVTGVRNKISFQVIKLNEYDAGNSLWPWLGWRV